MSGIMLQTEQESPRLYRASSDQIDYFLGVRAKLSAFGTQAWASPPDIDAATAAMGAFMKHAYAGPPDMALLDRPDYPRRFKMFPILDFIYGIWPVSSTAYAFYTRTEPARPSVRDWRGLNAQVASAAGFNFNLGAACHLDRAASFDAAWLVEAVKRAMAAAEAGAWLFVAPKHSFQVGAFCVRPVARFNSEDQHHCTDGPAIYWPDQPDMPRYFYTNGVRMRDEWIERPDLIKADDISRLENTEQRRELIKLIGYDRYVREGGFRLLSSADREYAAGAVPKGLINAKLWQKEVGTREQDASLASLARHGRAETIGPGSVSWQDGVAVGIGLVGMGGSSTTIARAPMVLLELQNSSKEPDGTYKTYFLRVPPEMRTVTEAAAWTLRLSTDEYKKLAAET